MISKYIKLRKEDQSAILNSNYASSLITNKYADEVLQYMLISEHLFEIVLSRIVDNRLNYRLNNCSDIFRSKKEKTCCL